MTGSPMIERHRHNNIIIYAYYTVYIYKVLLRTKCSGRIHHPLGEKRGEFSCLYVIMTRGLRPPNPNKHKQEEEGFRKHNTHTQ